jgi:hypothetical protein
MGTTGSRDPGFGGAPAKAEAPYRGACAGVEAVHAGPFTGPGEFIPRRLKLCRLLRCQGINGLRAAGAWRHESRKGCLSASPEQTPKAHAAAPCARE